MRYSIATACANKKEQMFFVCDWFWDTDMTNRKWN